MTSSVMTLSVMAARAAAWARRTGISDYCIQLASDTSISDDCIGDGRPRSCLGSLHLALLFQWGIQCAALRDEEAALALQARTRPNWR
jgi:hypothetical protein